MNKFRSPEITPQIRTHWGQAARLYRPLGDPYDLIVISDTHFPRSDSHPKYLYEFLDFFSCETTICLGDTHEGYDTPLKKYEPLHMRVMNLIHFRKSQGSVFIDVPGNHDSFKRQEHILNHNVVGTIYRPHTVVSSHLGPTLLLHGDGLYTKRQKEYDRIAYEWAKKIRIRRHSLVDLYSYVTGVIQPRDKSFNHNNKIVQHNAALAALSHKCNAVLTGHTHRPAPFRTVQSMPSVSFGNTGAWVGGQCTAMGRTSKGVWHLINWRQEREKYNYSGKPSGLLEGDPHRSYADHTHTEWQWLALQHELYGQIKIRDMIAKTQDQMDLAHQTLPEMQKKNSERIEELEIQNSAFASLIDPRPAPA